MYTNAQPEMTCCVCADEMALDAALSETEHNFTVAGVVVVAEVRIERTYLASISFAYLGKAYTFTITKWSGRGFSNFLKLFFAAEVRNVDRFGVLDLDAEGNITAAPSTEQKARVVLKACEDVMALFDRILVTHGRSVLDYAVWYRESGRGEETYKKYIARVACHCIVHTNFLAGGLAYDIVE